MLTYLLTGVWWTEGGPVASTLLTECVDCKLSSVGCEGKLPKLDNISKILVPRSEKGVTPFNIMVYDHKQKGVPQADFNKKAYNFFL